MKKLSILAIAFAAVVFAACGGKKSEQAEGIKKRDTAWGEKKGNGRWREGGEGRKPERGFSGLYKI